MNLKHLHILVCPKCKSNLELSSEKIVDGRVESGILRDHNGHVFPIVKFIPRFVSPKNYASNFSAQWESWPELLSHYDGYRLRFEQETKWGSNLTGRLMMEAGCGAGTFTEFALATEATVLSFDLSDGGVRANYKKNGHKENLLIVQADIFNIPARDGNFDYIYCFGVLQHTPAPKAAFLNLSLYLKRGVGKIATDIYTMPPPNHPYEPLWINKYRMRRLLKNISDQKIYKLVVCYVNIFWPITRIILKLFPKKGVQYNRHFLFDDYPPRLPGMDPKKFKAFAMLDIHDFLAPDYDEPATEAEYRSWHVEAGLNCIDVHPGYNGLEGRGTCS